VAATRVTKRPLATATISAGICATSPSPIDSSEYVWIAWSADRPRWPIPTTRPPSKLMATMTIAAIASPLTNRMAPSIAP
jgi:hypothetical protein